MISPSKLAPDYPLSFENANPIPWDQIPDSEKIDGKSYNHVSYEY